MSIGTGLRLRLASCAAACIAAMSVPAHDAFAGTIDWQFSFSLSDGESASGTLVTVDSPSGGPFLVTSIQNGLLNGNVMTLLAPGGTGPFNDDLLSETNPFLDNLGLGFTAEGHQWSIWSQNGSVVDSWCNNATLGADHHCTFASDPNGTVLSFNIQEEIVSAVPEPDALSLIGSGLVALGFGRRSFGRQTRRSDRAL